MKVEIRNICKVLSAVLNVTGIAVVAGDNNTGKSTIGRSVFAFANALYSQTELMVRELKEKLEEKIEEYWQKRRMNESLSDRWLRQKIILSISNLTNTLCKLWCEKNINMPEVRKAMENILHKDEEMENADYNEALLADFLDEVSPKLLEILSVKEDDLLNTLVQNSLLREFDGQICAFHAKAESFIQCDGSSCSIVNNEVTKLQLDGMKHSVIYIDDPFVLDSMGGSSWRMRGIFGEAELYMNHREHLVTSLQRPNNDLFQETLIKSKLLEIKKLLNQVCSGEVVPKNNGDFSLRQGENEPPLKLVNVSTGMKMFLLIERLLQTGALEQDGVLILDEPEVHLHPDWQLIFAQVVVELHKNFGIHILLNTHSPYFMRALEVYAAEYGVAERCKYYLSKLTPEGSVFEDKTETKEEIYRKFSAPLQALESRRCKE